MDKMPAPRPREDKPLAQRGAVTVLPRQGISRRPPDRCSECELLNAPIVVALDLENRSVIGCYRCPRCGYAWWTSWAPELVG
jgi:hypothetical protein